MRCVLNREDTQGEAIVLSNNVIRSFLSLSICSFINLYEGYDLDYIIIT
jgi:hypothetical protein